MKLAMDAADVQANSYCEVILALPGESKASHYKTLRTVMEAGFTRIIVWQLMMLLGSDINTPETKRKYAMDLRYRILPRCFGVYEALGKRLISAEIEEICVGNNTMSFEDYLECRRMHLFINIFYTDALFGGVLKFLRHLGVSAYDWMEVLRDERPEGRLRELLDRFVESTRTELWQNRDDLDAFIRKPGIIQEYLTGERGYNLIFVHKALAISDYARELLGHAYKTLQIVLRSAGKDSMENLAFLEELLRFDGCRMKDILTVSDEKVTSTFKYDVQRFCDQEITGDIASYKFVSPVSYRFDLDEAQRQRIAGFRKVYGKNTLGAAFILARVYVNKLLRRPLPMRPQESKLVELQRVAATAWGSRTLGNGFLPR